MKSFSRCYAFVLMIISFCTLSLKNINGQLIKLDLQKLFDKSELIVVANVELLECRWKKSNEVRTIVTFVNLKVQDVIKGNFKNSELVLEIPGGQIGDTAQYVTNSVTFETNEKAILFLKTNPLKVIGGFQGKITDYNGRIFIENQKIDTRQFINLLKSATSDSLVMEKLLEEIKKGTTDFMKRPGEPFIEISKDSIPSLSIDELKGQTVIPHFSVTGVKESVEIMSEDNFKTKSNSTDDYRVYGKIFDFIAETDDDDDGYYENFRFKIGIDGDVDPGPAKVYMRIICKTTDQTWWSSDSFIITGSETDYHLFAFDNTDFAAYQLNSELDFTVELWDSTRTAILASDISVDGEPVKADRIFSDSIVGSILSFTGSDTDHDGYYESFIFILRNMIYPIPFPKSVRIKMICNTTDQAWWSPLFTVTSDSWDQKCKEFRFDHKDFEGFISGNTGLDFTVEMWNSSKTWILARDDSIANEPVKADIISDNDYTVDGIIESFIGKTDYDHDGYYENFEFKLGIRGTASPGPSDVYMGIICHTTDQSWITNNKYSISDTYGEYKYFTVYQSDFEGLITGNTNLDFTVVLLDDTKTNIIAIDKSVTGEPVKADYTIPPSISGITPDKASAGTNTEVIITGNNFGDPPDSTEVAKVEFFHRSGEPKITAPVISWSDTQIKCIVPCDGHISAGSGPVTVKDNSGQVSNEFLFRITFGYGLKKWPVNEMEFRINENEENITGEGEAIINAATRWSTSGSNFVLRYNGAHTNTSENYDGKNDIMWGESDAIAHVLYTWISDKLVDCDMVFNEELSWSTLSDTPSATHDVESIALHEFGHFLHLKDLYGDVHDGIYDVGKVMYGVRSSGDIRRDLHTDDVSGIKYIYGIYSPSRLTISGHIETSDGTGISGVSMSGVKGSLMTDNDGYYSAIVDYGWSGTVTPSLSGYKFDPSSRKYTNVQNDLSGEDYIASNTTYIESDEKNNHNPIILYPNPTEGKILLKSSIEIPEDIIISIFDESGKLLSTKKIINLYRGEERIVDISNYKSGIYYLHLLNRKYNKIVKVIRQ